MEAIQMCDDKEESIANIVSEIRYKLNQYIKRSIAEQKVEEFFKILLNISLKLKTVADNAILLKCFTSSENISERIKTKTENLFNLKVNV